MEGTIHETASGLRYIDMGIGPGPQPAMNQRLLVQYTGYLTDGTIISSSYDDGTPFEFVLGANEVIPGWEEGVATMKLGSRRRLFIPPALAYGSTSVGNIPPNAELIFDIELISMK